MENKWAFITGASSGIGKSFALQLAGKGYDIVLLARRENRLLELKNDIQINNPILQVEIIVQDLVKENAIENINNVLTQKKIKIVALINNAGIGYFELFEKTSFEQKLATIQLNVVACTKILDYFLSHMLAHKKESFVCTIASLAGYIPIGNLAVYSASKAYLNSLSETLSTEFKNTNISFTTISPGGVSTEFSEKSNQEVNKNAGKSMMTANAVVSQSLNALFNKKRRYIPGFFNKLSLFIFRFSPKSFAIDVAFKVMSKNVSKIT